MFFSSVFHDYFLLLFNNNSLPSLAMPRHATPRPAQPRRAKCDYFFFSYY